MKPASHDICVFSSLAARWLVRALLLAPCVSFATVQYRIVAPALPQVIDSQDGATASGGVAVALAREAAARAGIRITVDIQPWARAYETGSKNKDVFLMPVVRSPEREALFEWLGPVNRQDFKLYRLKGSNAPAIKSIDHLGTWSVGVLQNIFVHKHLRDLQLPNIHSSTSYPNLVAMFVSERFEYLASTRESLKAELAKHGKSLEAVEELCSVDADSAEAYSYLTLAKGSDPALVDRLKRAFSSMLKDGSWARIFQQHP